MARVRNPKRNPRLAVVAILCSTVLPVAPPITFASPVPVQLDCVDPGSFLPLVLVGDIGEQQPEPTPERASAAEAGELLLVRFDTPSATWVDDPSVGPKLADFVTCLAERSEAGGGPGVVAIVAASTGAFVVRWALHELDKAGGLAAVGGVMTVGSSDDGFWVGAPQDPTLTQTQRDVRQLFVAAGGATCETAPVVPFEAICQRLLEPNSPFVANTAAGSGALADLPPWPDGLQVLRLGGRLQVSTNVFDETFLPLGDVGDGAMDTPTEAGAVVLDCRFNLVDPTSTFNDVSCAHSQIRRSPQVPIEVESLEARLRFELSPREAAFALNCGDNASMLAVFPLAPGSEVTAAIAGYRVAPMLGGFEYSPERPGRFGYATVGQRILLVQGDIEFAESIAPGDRVQEGQVIGHVSDTPHWHDFQGVFGTAFVVAFSLPPPGVIFPAENEYLASVYPYDIPDTCGRH